MCPRLFFVTYVFYAKQGALCFRELEAKVSASRAALEEAENASLRDAEARGDEQTLAELRSMAAALRKEVPSGPHFPCPSYKLIDGGCFMTSEIMLISHENL